MVKVIKNNHSVIYVGDPMCSWCWGISPDIKRLQEYCKNHSISFSILVGGLRAGGGQKWNNEFKDFLRSTWTKINEISGQPFNFEFFKKQDFNSDTEPCCRAVVSVKNLLESSDEYAEKLYDFFASIHKKFYIDNQDPSRAEFYESLCKEAGFDYEQFLVVFESEKTKQQTQSEFELSQKLGVRGFPSLLFFDGFEYKIFSSGYSNSDNMIERLSQIVKS